MRGVKIVEEYAFGACGALEDVECDKLEIIGDSAFGWSSLRSINLPSARIVDGFAFRCCTDLTNVKFGSKLEEIDENAFCNCRSLERITIPLKDGLFTEDDTFKACDNFEQVDLVEGEIHETISTLHLEEWRNDMNDEIQSINQILPNAYAGTWNDFDEGDPGEKTQAIRRWIRSVLRKITDYQAEHRHLLEEDVVATLQLVIPNDDIVMNNVLPFLELPPYVFEVDDEDTDSEDEEQPSESSLGDEDED